MPEHYRQAAMLPGPGSGFRDPGQDPDHTTHLVARAQAGKYPPTAIAGLPEPSAMASWASQSPCAWYGASSSTKSGIMADTDEIAVNLALIEQLGIRLLVDDFGTSHASLSQLQRLPLNGLKADRSFTTVLAHGREGEMFYRAIVSMANALGMSVVAEGVETPAELQVPQKLGCDQIQGYLVSRPVPADKAAALMERRYLFSRRVIVSGNGAAA